MKRLALAILATAIGLCANAQQQTILQGRITDSERHEAMAGVTVYAEDGSAYTSSNGEGRYVLKLNAEQASGNIVFSMVGYRRDTVSVAALLRKPDRRLAPNIVKLREVSVEEYKKIPDLVQAAVARIPRNFHCDTTIGTFFFRDCRLLNNDIFLFDEMVFDALRVGLFQVTSFITTTGILNDDPARWHHITWVILSLCMFFGACSGSTSGGFKCIRIVMVFTIMKNEIRRILHPRAVLPVRVNDNIVPYSSQVTLLAFLAAYVGLCIFTYFCMISTGVDPTNSITIALSCAGNVGPTLGLEIGPTMSWGILPMGVKWLLSGLMLMGRLEIFTVVVLFTSDLDESE